MDQKIDWTFNIKKIDQWQKVWAQVSLREMRRLTWTQTFYKYIKAPLTDRDKYIHVCAFVCDFQDLFWFSNENASADFCWIIGFTNQESEITILLSNRKEFLIELINR